MQKKPQTQVLKSHQREGYKKENNEKLLKWREREREREKERKKELTLAVDTVHKWYYDKRLKWGLLNVKDIFGVLHKLHGRRALWLPFLGTKKERKKKKKGIRR